MNAWNGKLIKNFLKRSSSDTTKTNPDFDAAKDSTQR